jgi:L-ascorbate metabolism protein UlaG (beta-lactamase superfamily)
MIEPVQSGEQLLRDIAETTVEHGQAAFWWLGQSGYAIRTASQLWYVDPYLSEHLTTKYAGTDKPHTRMTRAPLRGADLRDVRLVFSSHKHSDHLDPGSMPDLFAHNPQAKLVLSAVNLDYAAGLGLDRARLIGTRGDETINVDGLTVHVLPAAHPTFEQSAAGYPFLSFVFEVDGVRIYHSGDTLVYDGLAERLRTYQPHVLILPINGTDERRNQLQVPPNMNMDEALALAAAVGQPLMIPHHYDMFTFNTADVNDFVRAADAAGQPYRVLQCGERFVMNAVS